MRVSKNWLKELVDLKIPIEELIKLLPLRTIGIKEATVQFIELDMKGYNRADLLSLRGVAFEIAAITDSKITFDHGHQNNYCWNKKNLPALKVEIENPVLCPTYCLAKIEGLKIKPSSQQWIDKLTDCGIRPVNNVADVTNLIMLEYGQPMHAFDADKVKGNIKVRVAKKGEKILTLDGKIRSLNEEDLLIADAERPIGIAGVMGGKDSEVSQLSSTILLEAAIFGPAGNRNTAKRHNLPSEASKRFQHGLTKANLLQALAAAIKMYEDLGGKLTAITMVGDLQDQVKTIQLTQQKINSLIGVEIPPEDIESSLKKLGFRLEAKHLEGEIVWNVIVPYWRLDIAIEEDLIEEVARMYGYEKIPPKELEGEIPPKSDQSLPNFIYDLKKTLVKAGLTEVQTYSFYSSKILSALHLSLDALIKIANPISSETEYLKDNLWPNLLEAAAKNARQGYKDIAIFEVGKVYSPVKEDLPKEVYHLSIAISNGSDNPIQELYQLSQSLALHLRGVKLNPREYFHPTRYTDGIAEIHPRFINKFGIDERVAVLELEIRN